MAFIIGEIQNATGSERVRTTDLPSSADIDGHVVAKALGKNLIDVSNFMVDTFISGTTGNFGTLAGTRTSQRLKVNPNTDYYLSTDDRATFRYEDKDGNVLSFIEYGAVSEIGITTPNNCEYLYVYYSRDGTDANKVQLEQGTTPTTYEPWEGLYYNDDETGPIPDGVIIPVLNGKAQAYLADGTQPNAVAVGGFSGSLKANADVVDGVVDLQLGQQTILGSNTTFEIESSRMLNIYNTSAGTFKRVGLDYETENLLVTCVVTATNNIGADLPHIDVRDLGDTTTLVNQDITDGVETRIAFTPIDSGFNLRLYATYATSELGDKDYDVVFYYGDYVTGTPPLPASGQLVSGNSLVNRTTKYNVVQADKLTTVQMYDHTDPNAVVAKVVPVDDFVASPEDNPRFSTVTVDDELTQQGLYSKTLVDPCLSNAENFFKAFVELTDEGDEFITTEDDLFISLG